MPDRADLAVPSDAPHPRVVQALDRVLAVQRPLVLAHLRSIRAAHPEASPELVIRSLERRYLLAVTGGGAAVGVTAAIPAVGTATALAISGAETVGFLEATALFAQSVTEVHGIAVTDPERARTLVMALLLGGGGQDLVRQLAGQAAGGPGRSAYWGELVTRQLPRVAVDRIAARIRTAFLRRVAVTQGGSFVGRALPFGVGAVIGGAGNHVLGRAVVQAARQAFGPAPATFPADLAVIVPAAISGETIRRVAVRGLSAPATALRRLPLRRRPVRELPAPPASPATPSPARPEQDSA
jgi:hypothetical protein